MPRLTKQNKAAVTQAYKKIHQVEKSGQAYTLDNEIEFITETKSAVLNLPYKYITWLGAKWSGKTRPVVTRMVGMMLTDPTMYGLALKKYKTNAATRLHTAISNMSIEIRSKGYNVPIMAKGISNTYLLKNKHIRDLNQSIEYASLDDMDGIAGIEAPNLGRFGIVHIEEPVMSGDKNIPTKEDFWETMAILESSVDRSNARYADLNDEEVLSPTYHFTMNAWDDHPLVVEAEEAFPEDEFLNGCLGVTNWQKLTLEEIDENWADMQQSLIDNNTAVRTVSRESKAFVRTTLFANPNWSKAPAVYNPKLEFTKEEQVEMFWNKIKQAIIDKNYSALAIYLGLKKQASNGNKVYVLDEVQTTDTLKEIAEGGWKVIGTSQGWDIDTNRLFCNTQVVLCQRVKDLSLDYKMFVLPQVEMPAYGDGSGRNIPIYRDNMLYITDQVWKRTSKFRGAVNPELGSYLYLDDNHGQWLQYFQDEPRFIPGKAKKHGHWSILTRQIWLNRAINAGFIVFDKKNGALLDELRKSVKQEGTDQRDESGSLHKNYDRINSLEYAIYPLHHHLNTYLYNI